MNQDQTITAPLNEPQTAQLPANEVEPATWAEALIDSVQAEFKYYMAQIASAKTQAKRDFYKRKIQKMGKRLNRML